MPALRIEVVTAERTVLEEEADMILAPGSEGQLGILPRPTPLLTALEPGDAVLIHTGWGTLWNTDPERFSAGGPGIGVTAAQWLVDRDPMLLGSDNFPVEVSPNPDPQLSLPVHQMMLVVHGIHLVERMKLDALAAAQAHEFAFVIQPLKLQGATGSTVAPVAIR